eukprot:Platyproteum_vivax@DN357_c0_g1_i2.p1
MPESSYSLIFYSRNRLQLFLMVGMLLIHLQNGVAVEQKERKSVEIQLHLKSHKNSNFASELEEGHLVNTKFVSGWNRAPNVDKTLPKMPYHHKFQGGKGWKLYSFIHR